MLLYRHKPNPDLRPENVRDAFVKDGLDAAASVSRARFDVQTALDMNRPEPHLMFPIGPFK